MVPPTSQPGFPRGGEVYQRLLSQDGCRAPSCPQVAGLRIPAARKCHGGGRLLPPGRALLLVGLPGREDLVGHRLTQDAGPDEALA